mmetsp:Transcript_53858/g.117147  ORF Transcript_53858/g.117147 Transcript_53858/m.117147 type:complete len:225 (-) Transcript_53858:658-1332(-)
MPWLAASHPISVIHPLAIGVRRPICSSTFFSSSGVLAVSMPSEMRPVWYTMAREPSVMALMKRSMRRTSGCTMSGSAGLLGSLVPDKDRIDPRSLVYGSAPWMASSLWHNPWRAVPRRAVFMKVNICLRPEFSLPISQPLEVSKVITHVALPLMPILFSRRVQTTFFLVSREPSSLTMYLGMRKREMPLMPSGAPSMRARTMWTMFSAISWSPALMKIFSPEME